MLSGEDISQNLHQLEWCDETLLTNAMTNERRNLQSEHFHVDVRIHTDLLYNADVSSIQLESRRIAIAIIKNKQTLVLFE